MRSDSPNVDCEYEPAIGCISHADVCLSLSVGTQNSRHLEEHSRKSLDQVKDLKRKSNCASKMPNEGILNITDWVFIHLTSLLLYLGLCIVALSSIISTMESVTTKQQSEAEK